MPLFDIENNIKGSSTIDKTVDTAALRHLFLISISSAIKEVLSATKIGKGNTCPSDKMIKVFDCTRRDKDGSYKFSLHVLVRSMPYVALTENVSFWNGDKVEQCGTVLGCLLQRGIQANGLQGNCRAPWMG